MAPDKKRRTTQDKESKDDVDATPDNEFRFATGDVRILVTDARSQEQIIGRVSSDALCLASSVWKKFLFPPWEAEEPTKDVQEIDCSGDDSEALLILLSIAHLKFQNVPNNPQYATLLQIAVLCDQYDCVGLVRPWLSETLWLKDELADSILPDHHQWLFIAWVFGREKVFENLASRMVTSTDMLHDFPDEASWINLHPMPPQIMENILSLRKELIEVLLQIPYEMMDDYENTYKLNHGFTGVKRVLCNKGGSAESVESCDALVYGSLVLGLVSKDLFPRKDVEDILISVSELKKCLMAIKLRSYLEADRSYSSYSSQMIEHYGCGRKSFHDRLEQVLVKIPNPVLASHLQHIKAQNTLLSL